jgi:F420-non-reducing hydrogenase small subunit
MAENERAGEGDLPRFAVLQLSGCSGCEVSLLNAGQWIEEYTLVYMPLVLSAYEVPRVDVLLISGGVRSDEDLYNLRRAAARAERVVPVGTCAISGGVASLGDRDEVREVFMAQEGRRHVPHLLPRCRPVDAVVEVDRYLPGCPPTPDLFMALLFGPPDLRLPRIVCQECGRQKLRDVRPRHLVGFQQGVTDPDICLINQGYACVGTSTRGGCGAPCPRAGHPCVGCRGPSDTFIDKESGEWMASIQRVFAGMTEIPADELEAALRSPQMALFLFQFSDYAAADRPPRPKEKVL